MNKKKKTLTILFILLVITFACSLSLIIRNEIDSKWQEGIEDLYEYRITEEEEKFTINVYIKNFDLNTELGNITFYTIIHNNKKSNNLEKNIQIDFSKQNLTIEELYQSINTLFTLEISNDKYIFKKIKPPSIKTISNDLFEGSISKNENGEYYIEDTLIYYSLQQLLNQNILSSQNRLIAEEILDSANFDMTAYTKTPCLFDRDFYSKEIEDHTTLKYKSEDINKLTQTTKTPLSIDRELLKIIDKKYNCNQTNTTEINELLRKVTSYNYIPKSTADMSLSLIEDTRKDIIYIDQAYSTNLEYIIASCIFKNCNKTSLLNNLYLNNYKGEYFTKTEESKTLLNLIYLTGLIK